MCQSDWLDWIQTLSCYEIYASAFTRKNSTFWLILCSACNMLRCVQLTKSSLTRNVCCTLKSIEYNEMLLRKKTVHKSKMNNYISVFTMNTMAIEPVTFQAFFFSFCFSCSCCYFFRLIAFVACNLWEKQVHSLSMLNIFSLIMCICSCTREQNRTVDNTIECTEEKEKKSHHPELSFFHFRSHVCWPHQKFNYNVYTISNK